MQAGDRGWGDREVEPTYREGVTARASAWLHAPRGHGARRLGSISSVFPLEISSPLLLFAATPRSCLGELPGVLYGARFSRFTGICHELTAAYDPSSRV